MYQPSTSKATSVLVVGDDEHPALVVLDGQDQRAQALAVQVIGGFVQDQHVGVLPHGRRQDHLHLAVGGRRAGKCWCKWRVDL